MTKKRIISFVLIIIVLVTLICTITGCGETDEIPIPKVEENVYIYDQDDVIDDAVEEQLNQMLVELEEKTGVKFAVISIESLLGRSIEEYSNEVFNTLDIDKDNSILLLFSRFDKSVQITIGTSLESIFHDSECVKIININFSPYRESDEYTKATEKTVKAVLNVLTEEYLINLQSLNSVSFMNEELISEVEWSPLYTVFIVIVLVILLIAIFFKKDSL